MRVLVIFWPFEHISRDDSGDRGEMYGRPLSQSRYVFVLQTYIQPTTGRSKFTTFFVTQW